IEMNIGQAEGSTREHFSILQRLTQQLLAEQPVYQCGHCGFDAQHLHWQCPTCKHWGTLRPQSEQEQHGMSVTAPVAHVASPVIVALDYANAADAIAMARQLSPQQVRVKVGKELFTRSGPQVVEQLQALGFEVFLDLKFHDIPNTVAAAVRAAAELGVWMVNV